MAKKAAAARPPSKAVVAKLLTPVQEFIRTESASGVLLIGAAALAFAWANSPWAASYFALLESTFQPALRRLEPGEAVAAVGQ